MPKSSNTHAARGSSLSSAMLSQSNLAQHTQHHQELDESRDFVREFLDTLDPFSAPQADPGLEPVELTPDIVLRSPSIDSKPRTHESTQQQQRRHNIRATQQSSQNHQSQQQYQQHKQNKHQQVSHIQQQHQPNSTHDKSKRKKVVKGHQEPPKRTNESQPILQNDRKHLIDGPRRKEGNGAVVKDDIHKGKKRKQEVEDVERGVQDLEIRDPHTDNPSSREKRKRQKEGTITKPKGPTVAKGKQALRQTSDTAVNNKPGKKYSNKPRKILTQSSLIMNQFVSPNVSRERITIPGKLDHLGIFKKGKASKKTTVQRDVGNEFSENGFLNQRTDSRESHVIGRHQEQVVTSAYFTDARKDQDGLAASKSSSSYCNMNNYEQSNSASITSFIDNAELKSDVKECAVASNHHIGRDLRDRRGVLSYHSSAHSSQQQLNRTKTHGSAPTTHVSSPQPLEDVFDTLLELNESGVQSPTQPTPAYYGQFQQSVPVQHVPAADPFAGSYNEPYPYGYAVPPPAPWQLETYHNIAHPDQQRVYPVYDNTVYDNSVPPACPPVFDQRLQPIEYAIVKTGTEYDHDLPLDGRPPQPVPPAVGSHFRWRPHRLF
ncbi:hypothetical protein BGW39_010041 [Mortierella sp. 14UC]|nr:hypothetical protein BGW39_010041 [Mortierella sp. 14UC]